MADLADAIFEKDRTLLDKLLHLGKHQVDAKLRPRDDITLLHLAVIMDWPEGVQVLCENGATLSSKVFWDGFGFDDYLFDQKIENGLTALGLAQRNGSRKCAEVLEEAMARQLQSDVVRVTKAF